MTRKKGAVQVALVSLSAALLVVSSWISIPFGAVPVTLQTFVIYVSAVVLGTKKSVAAVAVYLLLGILGVPVFSGFRGGFSTLLGATGGYIAGFVLIALVAGLITERFGKKRVVMFISFITGTLLCYVTGTLWYVFVYLDGAGAAGVIASCVLPFIIPDVIKSLLATFVAKAVAERSFR